MSIFGSCDDKETIDISREYIDSVNQIINRRVKTLTRRFYERENERLVTKTGDTSNWENLKVMQAFFS